MNRIDRIIKESIDNFVNDTNHNKYSAWQYAMRDMCKDGKYSFTSPGRVKDMETFLRNSRDGYYVPGQEEEDDDL